MKVLQNTSVISNVTELREKFVEGLNGTTMGEVVLFSMQFPLIAFVAVYVELLIFNRFYFTLGSLRMASKTVWNGLFVFLCEAFTIILPVILIFTLLADYVHIALLFVMGLITIIVTSSVSSADDRILYWSMANVKQVLLSENTTSKKHIFITYFRSFVLLVTAVSILGVDFHIFPRRFAKTETYGVSLMDLGVGLFIVSNALVENRRSSITEFKKTLSASLVLLVLGFLRYVLVQRLDYQMHVTEYGIHWNFFITLGLVKLLSSFSLNIFRGQSFICSLVLILAHQYFLTHSLESIVLSNKEREDWFSANREGIVSLSGYLSLHFMGITIANLVNPTDKNLLNKQKFKAVIMFTVISAFLFCMLYYFDSVGFKVSRRLANLPYVLWIIALSLELLTLFLLVEFLSVLFFPIDRKLRNNLYHLLTPTLLESVNFNGLLFFLLSNVITGLVNIYIDTLSSGYLISFTILFTYMFVDCGVVFLLYMLDIRLKF